MVDQKIIEEFVEQIKPDTKESNKTHSAIVSKIDEEGTVWVRVAGSDKDTPTALVGTEVKKGDAVNVEWRNNKLYIANNFSNPSAGVVRVEAVEQAAQLANEAANNAVLDAGRAKEAADSASAAAEQAKKDAGSAKESAESAGEYAARALGNLSTVQSVTETLNWITQHGTMTLTTDTALDPTHVYFVQDNNGDYVVGNVHYSVVTEPKLADISTYYELSINESLNNYVATHLALTDEGLYVLGGANQWKVLIAVDGVYIIDGTSGVDKVVAKYKDAITLGNDDGTESYIQLDYHSMQMKDKEGSTYFYVSDLRQWEYVLTFDTEVDSAKKYYELTGTDTYTEVAPTGTENPKDEEWYEYAFVATITETITKEILTADTRVTLPVYSVKSVKVNGNSANATEISGYSVYHTPAGDIGDEITIIYTTDSEKAKAYTLGKRGTGNIGALSIAEGSNTIAGGTASHTEGANTVASDNNAHAEGDSSIASNRSAHAEGYASEATGLCSHAEGMSTYAKAQSAHSEGQFTYATGLISHAEGFQCKASGESSHAQNVDTIAGYKAQTAIGKYNDNKNDTALEIGNGTSSSSRSNSHEFTWNGDIRLELDTSATSGTDKEIYDALVALGWASDVIS